MNVLSKEIRVTKYALVTGAGQGIGFGIARRLTDDGFHVYVTDQSGELAEQAARTLGGTPMRMDVSDPESVADAAAAVPDLDVLVNSAGIYPTLSFRDIDVAAFDRIFHINVLGPILTINAFAPHLERRGGGAIVNITSMMEDQASPGMGAYSASKAAAHGITMLAAVEYGGSGIRVNSVAPGIIQTEGRNKPLAEGAQPEPSPLLPLGREGAPADIAAAVSYLVGPGAAYVTGQSLRVDGGYTLSMTNFYRTAREHIVHAVTGSDSA
jgi:NAD(P)-dependent dehydrogenase (short-subunit alcohol dehydrogenase family)